MEIEGEEEGERKRRENKNPSFNQKELRYLSKGRKLDVLQKDTEYEENKGVYQYSPWKVRCEFLFSVLFWVSLSLRILHNSDHPSLLNSYYLPYLRNPLGTYPETVSTMFALGSERYDVGPGSPQYTYCVPYFLLSPKGVVIFS